MLKRFGKYYQILPNSQEPLLCSLSLFADLGVVFIALYCSLDLNIFTVSPKEIKTYWEVVTFSTVLAIISINLSLIWDEDWNIVPFEVSSRNPNWLRKEFPSSLKSWSSWITQNEKQIVLNDLFDFSTWSQL